MPLEYEESSPAADAARKRRERLYARARAGDRVLRAVPLGRGRGPGAREYLAGRGLGEQICKEFRLGLSPAASELARKAAEKGFTRAELAAAGLANRRGQRLLQRDG